MKVYIAYLNDSIIGVYRDYESAQSRIVKYEHDTYKGNPECYKYGINPRQNGRYYRVIEYEVL